jgi:hypothetical protein
MKSRWMNCSRNIPHMGNFRDVHNILVTRLEWKRGNERHKYGIILKWILKQQREDVNWIHKAQNRNQSRSIMNMIMKFQNL